VIVPNGPKRAKITLGGWSDYARLATVANAQKAAKLIAKAVQVLVRIGAHRRAAPATLLPTVLLLLLVQPLAPLPLLLLRVVRQRRAYALLKAERLVVSATTTTGWHERGPSCEGTHAIHGQPRAGTLLLHAHTHTAYLARTRAECRSLAPRATVHRQEGST